MAEVALHEDLGRKQEGQGGSDRSFGIVFAVFFTVLALLPLRSHRPVRWWALAIAALFLAIGLLQPGWLHPLNRLWTKLGLLLGRVVSPIVTGIVFFLVVTPIALIFRMLKKIRCVLLRAAKRNRTGLSGSRRDRRPRACAISFS